MTQTYGINKLEESLQKYIQNQKKIADLKGKYLKEEASGNDIIARIAHISTEQQQVFLENDGVLDYIMSYLGDFSRISSEVFERFQNFAVQLSNPKEQLDISIAYEIHKILLAYAKEKNDINLIVQESYYTGTCLFYISNKLFTEELLELFRVSETNLSHYFELDKKTREIFNRCYGNVLLGYSASRLVDYKPVIAYARRALEFWDRKDVTSFDPDFPFETYKFAIKRNLLVLLDVIRVNKITDTELLDLLLSVSTDLFEQRKKMASKIAIPIEATYTYMYYCVRFHAGKITIGEFLGILEELSNPFASDLYSLESRSRMIRQGSYYCLYLEYTDYSEEYKLELRTQMIERIRNYIRNMPMSVYEHIIQKEILAFISIFSTSLPEEDAFTLILELTIYRHLPTYIHVRMVSEISRIILDTALREIPEFFVGTLETQNVEEVLEKKDVFFETIRKSSMLHDIGKFFCLENVSNFGRKLTQKEFEIIKQHPLLGFEVLEGSKISKSYIESSLYHHRWFNQQGGYPDFSKNIATNLQTEKLINIITLADSIDAGTDYLGRPYAKRKKLEDLVSEFKEGYNTRYCGVLVDLFNNQDLCDKLNDLLKDGRKEITIDTYKMFSER